MAKIIGIDYDNGGMLAVYVETVEGRQKFVKERHGQWEVKSESQQLYCGEYDETFYLECSECKRKVWDISQTKAMFGEHEKIFADYPYCHCGAKMDGGVDK